MSPTPESDLLSRLVGKTRREGEKFDPWEALAATEPTHEAGARSGSEEDEKLNGLLQRINRLTQTPAGGESPEDAASGVNAEDTLDPDANAFVPRSLSRSTRSGCPRAKSKP